MKCVEVQKQIDLLLDDELDFLQREAVEGHFLQCRSCQKSYQVLQKTGAELKSQPNLLPNAFLDQQILQAFNQHHQSQKSVFWKGFLIPLPAFATILTLFALGCGAAFIFGRMSVSQIEPIRETTLIHLPETKIEKMVEQADPKIITITKYVKVPVVKEKEVIKVVQIEKPTNKILTPINERNTAISAPADEVIQTRFDNKNLQPISEIQIKVVKKGEVNE